MSTDVTTVTLTYRQDRPWGWKGWEMARDIKALAEERHLYDVAVTHSSAPVCTCGGCA